MPRRTAPSRRGRAGAKPSLLTPPEGAFMLAAGLAAPALADQVPHEHPLADRQAAEGPDEDDAGAAG